MSLPLISHSAPVLSTGDKGATFPYSAAHAERHHQSGLKVEISLDPPPSGRSSYCTEEVVRGRITVIRKPSSSYSTEAAVVSWVRSLALRFYCESRTTFWVILDDKEIERRKLEWQENAPPPVDLAEAVTRTMSRGSALKKADQKHQKKEQDAVRWSNEPEWARATFGEISLVSNGAIQGVGAEEQSDRFSLPFQCQLPAELAFDEWNYHQGADRSLHRSLRPSPPSVRDQVDASVEWVVEAVLDLRWASRSNLATPMHHSPTASEVSSIASVSTTSFDQDQLDPWRNSRGFLLSKPSRIVHRTILPVIPADAVSCDHDLSDEKVGSFAESERTALRNHAGRLSVGGKEAAKEKSQSWMKVIDLRSKALGSLHGHLTVELVAHRPLYLPRTNLRGSLSLYLDWLPAAKRRFNVGKSATDAVRVEEATLAVDQIVWTRGGSGKVKKSTTALRRLRVPLSIPLSACAASAAGARYKVRVPFDLREAQGHAEAKTLGPSYKTPNLEREYTITVSVRMSNSETDYCVAIVPFQLTSGVSPVVEGRLGGIQEGDEDEEDEEGEEELGAPRGPDEGLGRALQIQLDCDQSCCS